MSTIAALYVETNGIYYNLPSVDPWDQIRDARKYAGPCPVIAHPPCKRWGRFWHGSTRKPHQYKLGADEGCFLSALQAVRDWGGILEHPKDSRAWGFFGLEKPPANGGWVKADDWGYTCCVEQGWYGHASRKASWLYACRTTRPELRWGQGKQRLHPIALAKHGYEKARRIGIVAMIGGKDKEKIRDRTPIEFRNLLLSMVMGETEMLNMKQREECEHSLPRFLCRRCTPAPKTGSPSKPPPKPSTDGLEGLLDDALSTGLEDLF